MTILAVQSALTDISVSLSQIGSERGPFLRDAGRKEETHLPEEERRAGLGTLCFSSSRSSLHPLFIPPSSSPHYFIPALMTVFWRTGPTWGSVFCPLLVPCGGVFTRLRPLRHPREKKKVLAGSVRLKRPCTVPVHCYLRTEGWPWIILLVITSLSRHTTTDALLSLSLHITLRTHS